MPEKRARGFTECFEEAWSKLGPDEKVLEILKKTGPAYPYSPRYNYSDLIEHMRHTLLALCTCDPEGLPEYDLVEVYSRRQKLNDQLNELEKLHTITLEERSYIEESLRKLEKKWEEEFKNYIREICNR